VWKIGHEVGTDIYGPVLGMNMVTFKDKASGYGLSIALSSKGKADIPSAILECVNLYRQHGHHSKEFNAPINIMRSDSEAVYKSQQLAIIYGEEGITSKLSAPDQKGYNGSIENYHKVMGNRVTSMQHVPDMYQRLYGPLPGSMDPW
jgi:hypothetical protein